MIAAVAMAIAAGGLIGLSRQINGRLALTKGALGASFWNHLVGALALGISALAGWVLAGGPPFPVGLAEVPGWAWAGGTLGVIFVAAGSWLVARIGAANTALLVIAGQMISGALLDTLRGVEGAPLRALGVLVILAGVAIPRGSKG
ncbi:DMT family transporter [Rubellimicrobium roseum]|uniref:EamA-like transporter family protein n=1 Tax=Rubellimicrobium roseum TaxID=687525 RepID=A0A5C4NQN4_9RHOB|nr:DMT family transporter [Rubellimicrobium roseum]TNC74709.1 EamA-like transporter family protein [Rubellimicrobium roseum]